MDTGHAIYLKISSGEFLSFEILETAFYNRNGHFTSYLTQNVQLQVFKLWSLCKLCRWTAKLCCKAEIDIARLMYLKI